MVSMLHKVPIVQPIVICPVDRRLGVQSYRCLLLYRLQATAARVHAVGLFARMSERECLRRRIRFGTRNVATTVAYPPALLEEDIRRNFYPFVDLGWRARRVVGTMGARVKFFIPHRLRAYVNLIQTHIAHVHCCPCTPSTVDTSFSDLTLTTTTTSSPILGEQFVG